MTSINKLKKSEYKEGSILAFRNYQGLISVAKFSADKELFAPASSLSVLALEELCKSIILHFKSVNNDIPINELDKYFKIHKPKHIAAINIFLSINSEELTEKLMENTGAKNAKELMIVMGALLIAIAFGFHEAKISLKDFIKKSFFDSIKESGFYMGYDEKTRSWLDPTNSHDAASFSNIYGLIVKFAKQVEEWIFESNLSNEDLFNLLESLDDSIIDKDKLQKIKW